MHKRILIALMVAWSAFLVPADSDSSPRQGNRYFHRSATFPVINNYCAPTAPNSCFDSVAVAEIVAASTDGRLLIYTDSWNGRVGFVDISNPEMPAPGGTIGVGGEPTSVAVAGRYALVGVNTSAGDYEHPSGHLTVIDLVSRTIVPGAEAIDLGGQPDAVAVSKTGRYAAIVIENERDEDLGDGRPPQDPPGKLVRVEMRPNASPLAWSFSDISLTGLADKFPNDPEAEFVDINDDDIAVVSLQENNYLVLVDLATSLVTNHFSAGTVDLTNIDTDDDDVIRFDTDLAGVPREPDAVAWLSASTFATADEGDLDGGSRGFTIFHKNSTIQFTSGSEFEYLTGRIGHYPEGRSDNKGSEPESVEFARFESNDLLFVGSERSSVVGVYRLNQGQPEFVQVLPTGVGPEGLLAIPHRKLLVAANEEDNEEDGLSERAFRSSITVFRYEAGEPTYPTIVSETTPNGTPIPWAALSGLGAHPTDPGLAYSVSDSAYEVGFIYPMDIRRTPAVITGRIAVTDGQDAENLDLEGVTVRSDGTLWLASEGDDDEDEPLANRIFRASPTTGMVLGPVVFLPASVQARRTGNGFEGIAVTGRADVDETVYVAFQREWMGDPAGKVRIGVYDVDDDSWGFLYYPLDAVASPNGGWVGLSEIVHTGGDNFAVIERDNQAGADARIKRIYGFSVGGLIPEPDCVGVCDFPTVAKHLVRDLIPDLQAPRGAIIEKVEGLALTADGRTLIHTDNDAVDDSNGETQYLDLGLWVLP